MYMLALLSVVPYAVVFSPLALATLGVFWGGWWTWAAVVLVFGVVPSLDVLLGEDRVNKNPREPHPRLAAWGYRAITHLIAPAIMALVLFAAWQVSQRAFEWWELAGLVLSVGVCSGGVGITVAHELIHKTNWLERSLGQLLLLHALYMHFTIEHLIGHHGRVATKDDPASARLGESVYRFYPRTVIGSFLSAWHLEQQRLTRLGLSSLHWRNQMLWFVVLPIVYAAGLASVWGETALLFYVLQGVVAFSLLEVTNYLEHYGLEREELGPGRYEKVGVAHSWSSANRLTNYFLVRLQRHADHHMNAMRRYEALQHYPEGPQLPTGYAGMILLALIPPLWFKVMNPRVQAVRHQAASNTH
jgi:alkane 1-monooxygenase